METSSNQEMLFEMSQDLILKLKLTEEGSKEDDYGREEEFHEEHEEYDEEEEEDDDEEEFSFSFAFDGVITEQISAEEAFDNGQIKPVFPLFNRDLLLADVEDLESLKLNDRVPNVKKVFLEANNDSNDSSSTTGDDEVVGPYCEWSKKAVEVVAPEGCKKSNSTGFSKIWRFKDLMHRCNSDGRDAFVFLNNTSSSAASTTGKREEKVARDMEKKEGLPEKIPAGGERKVGLPEKIPTGGERKVNGNEGVVGEAKLKKLLRKKKPAPSPHEVYLRSKAKEVRRSYLPYRPELVGFFTNVSGGGLTRNVHPF